MSNLLKNIEFSQRFDLVYNDILLQYKNEKTISLKTDNRLLLEKIVCKSIVNMFDMFKGESRKSNSFQFAFNLKCREWKDYYRDITDINNEWAFHFFSKLLNIKKELLTSSQIEDIYNECLIKSILETFKYVYVLDDKNVIAKNFEDKFNFLNNYVVNFLAVIGLNLEITVVKSIENTYWLKSKTPLLNFQKIVLNDLLIQQVNWQKINLFII